MFILFSLPGFAFANWISRTPKIRNILQVSTALMGWIIFGLAVGSIIGLVVISIAAIFSIAWLVFARLIIFGIGYGSVEVAINLEGTELERRAKKTFLPALHACFSAGTLARAGFGFICIRLATPVSTHLTIVGIIVFIILISVYRNMPSGTGKIATTAKDEKGMKRQKLNVWKEPRTMLIGVIVLGMAFAEGSANNWLPIAMIDGFNVDSSTGTAIFSVFLAAMFMVVCVEDIYWINLVESRYCELLR